MTKPLWGAAKHECTMNAIDDLLTDCGCDLSDKQVKKAKTRFKRLLRRLGVFAEKK